MVQFTKIIYEMDGAFSMQSLNNILSYYMVCTSVRKTFPRSEVVLEIQIQQLCTTVTRVRRSFIPPGIVA